MSYFAPVAPIQVLEQLYEFDPKVFGEYHLLLAHHTAANAERFHALFSKVAADGIIKPLVIMDNSVVECGGSVDFDMMHSACHAVADTGVDVMGVLPDVMGKGYDTRCASGNAYKLWSEGLPCAGFMAVCQGEDLDDYIQSLRYFADRGTFPLIEFLGIPRVLEPILGTREIAVRVAAYYARKQGQSIHLLGYSDNTADDLKCSLWIGVYGIDSAVPLRVGECFEFGAGYPARPKDWFDTAQMTDTMLFNLGTVRRMHAQR